MSIRVLIILVGCLATTIFSNIVDAATLTNGWYKIVPAHTTGKCIEVSGGESSNQTNIHIWEDNGSNAQKFYLQNVDNGYFILKTGCGDNKYVDVKWGNAVAGANIWQYEKEPVRNNAQKFRLIDGSNGTYYIESKLKPGLVFDCAGAGTKNGNNVQLWTRENVNWHKWRFVKVSAPQNISRYKTLTNGWYKIVPAHTTGKCIEVSGGESSNQTNIHIWEDNGSNAQKFYLQNVDNGYFILKTGCGDNKYVDVKWGNAVAGANIWQYEKEPVRNNAQKFRLIDGSNGTYYIESKLKSGLVFDCSGGGTGNGNNVQLWTRENVNWHKWRLVSTSAPINLVKTKVDIVSRSETTVDSFNGVYALYPNYVPDIGHAKYNCAALVKRYYEEMYGVKPTNLVPYSTPKSSSKSFTKVSVPQVGDIVGMKNSSGTTNGHWGIVKAVEGNNIVLFEQNWRCGNYAYKNRRVSINSVNLYRLN